jgi:hypothetical protein
LIIPFPERIELVHATTFGILLCAFLMLSGTAPLFAALALVFVVVSTLAFNVAGGLTRPSGSYVFFFAVLTIIVGLVAKVILWEPADLLLKSSVTTIGAYTGGMVGMLGAVYVSRRFSRKEGFLQDICSLDEMGLAAMGCVVGGAGFPFLAGIAASTGSALFLPLVSAFQQLNRFLIMGIILGVTYEIRKSGGKRSFNTAVVVGWGFTWYIGVFLGFSKENLFSPFLCWLAACAVLRYRFTLTQLATVFLLLLFSVFYMVPYCQYGRGTTDTLVTSGDRISNSFSLLMNLGEVREKYLSSEASTDLTEGGWRFFKNNEGLLDRLQMAGIDDALITVTDEKGTIGMSNYLIYIANVIPRVIWKDKPEKRIGNDFAHEIGFNEADTTTGISFSPVSEAYHEAKWYGVLIIAPILWTPLFVMMDSLCGDLRKSPWGILVFAFFAHIAPEGGLGGVFYMLSYGFMIVVMVAYFSAYLMPLLAAFVMPPKRNAIPIGTGRAGGEPAFLPAEPKPSEE